MESTMEPGREETGAWVRIVHLSRSDEQTQALGRVIGELLQLEDIALLMGDLGSGKTTLARGICQGAGVGRGTQVRSPTFTLINEYTGRTPIRHADLYRVESAGDFSTIGLFDPTFSGITVVEWAERLPEGMDITPAIIIRLREVSESEREIVMECPASLGSQLKRLISAA